MLFYSFFVDLRLRRERKGEGKYMIRRDNSLGTTNQKWTIHWGEPNGCVLGLSVFYFGRNKI